MSDRLKSAANEHPSTEHGSLCRSVMVLWILFNLIGISAALAPTTFSGSWTVDSPVLTREVDHQVKQFYYEAIEVIVSMTGTYAFASNGVVHMNGDLYDDEFDPVNPSQNRITPVDVKNDGEEPLKISITLQAEHVYVLVVSPHLPKTTGEFSIVSFGPAMVDLQSAQNMTTMLMETSAPITWMVPATYHGSLTSKSPTFYRPNGSPGYYFYQALQVSVETDGVFMFTSNSSIDTYGFFYNGTVDPSYPTQNLMASNDDSGNNAQFLIQLYLSAATPYVLLVTTYSQNVTGNFSISSVSLTELTSSTSRPFVTSITTSPVVLSTYSGSLSSSSPVFIRPYSGGLGYYYYQAIRVTVPTNGIYTFTSSSIIDTYGFFYDTSFDPLNPIQNLINYDDDSGGDQQFRIIMNLQSGRGYVLVVSTLRPGQTGSFVIRAYGPASIALTGFTPPTSRPISTTGSSLIRSSYNGSLSLASSTFFRPGSTSGFYYYQAIRVTISTSGTYAFTSSSSMDTYGYLYNAPVDPSYPSQNLITSDDDSGGDGQFLLSAYLSSGSTYALIVTTFISNTVGSFSIRVSGPSTAGLTSFIPTTSRPITIRTTTSFGIPWSSNNNNGLGVPAIVGIAVGCLVLLVVIVSVVYVSQKKSNMASRRRINPSPGYPMETIYPGAPRAYPGQTAYATPPFAGHPNRVPEPVHF